jgi:hypothetical protein
MTAEQFAYWFQGFAELNGDPPTAEQWQSIKEHLQTVFVKVTPPVLQPNVQRVSMPQWPPSDPMEQLRRQQPPLIHTQTIC